MRRTRLVTAIALVRGRLTFGAGSQLIASADAPAPLPSGTYCQGPQATQPATGPTHVVNIVLENESSVAVGNSPDATFERGTLDAQCGTFSETAMHGTTHPSEPNYVALESGLNPAINSGNDAQANFALSNCPPSATNLPPTSSCTNGRGQIAASTPSLYSLIEQQYGVAGWKGYADDMLGNCAANDGSRRCSRLSCCPTQVSRPAMAGGLPSRSALFRGWHHPCMAEVTHYGSPRRPPL